MSIEDTPPEQQQPEEGQAEIVDLSAPQSDSDEEQVEQARPLKSWSRPKFYDLHSDDSEASNPKLWLITFTDIIALMLTFFVLLYSMAVPDIKQWEQMTDALNFGISKLKSPQWYFGTQDEISIEKINLDSALDLNYLAALLQDIVKKDEALKNVKIIAQHDRLILSLPSDLLFGPEQTDVSLEGKKALYQLGEALTRIRNRIEVVGHADPRPLSEENAQFDNNWALSLARASQVAVVLDNAGYRRSITVRGLSSGRYEELPADLSEKERLDLSRRVDVIIMKDDGSVGTFLQLGVF